MKHPDEKILDEFRGEGICDGCLLPSSARHAAHLLMTRGRESENRLDVRFNLAALCLECHAAQHATGEPSVATLLVRVAQREGFPLEDLICRLYLLKRVSRKDADLCRSCLGKGFFTTADIPIPWEIDPPAFAHTCIVCLGRGLLDKYGAPFEEKRN